MCKTTTKNTKNATKNTHHLHFFHGSQSFFQFNPANPVGPLCEDASPAPGRCLWYCRRGRTLGGRIPKLTEMSCVEIRRSIYFWNHLYFSKRMSRGSCFENILSTVCDWSWCFNIFNETQQRPMAEKMPLFNFTGEDPLKICIFITPPLSIQMPCHVALLPLKTPASMKASTPSSIWNDVSAAKIWWIFTSKNPIIFHNS